MENKDYCVYYYCKKLQLTSIWYSNNPEMVFQQENWDMRIHNFELLKKVSDIEKEGGIETILKTYGNSIIAWANEIKNHPKLKCQFDYLSPSDNNNKIIHRTHDNNIIRLFKMLTLGSKTKKKVFYDNCVDEINSVEFKYFENTYNGGAVNLKKTGTYDLIGYDFKASYTTIMSSNLHLFGEKIQFLMPFKQGTEYNIQNLYINNLKYGIYHCKIKCDNDEFNLIFHINNKTNYYTHWDLEFCLLHQTHYNIKIKMFETENYNCLLYEKNELLDGQYFFGCIHCILKELKASYPKNGLIKMLNSSLWGRLSVKNTKWLNDEAIEKGNFVITTEIEDDDIESTHLFINEREKTDGTITKLLNLKQPYKYKFRLKPFLLSLQRIIIARICHFVGVDKVCRIQTDNITFFDGALNENLTETICPTFIKEDKTSGEIFYKNVNRYIKIDEIKRLKTQCNKDLTLEQLKWIKDYDTFYNII